MTWDICGEEITARLVCDGLSLCACPDAHDCEAERAWDDDGTFIDENDGDDEGHDIIWGRVTPS